VGELLISLPEPIGWSGGLLEPCSIAHQDTAVELVRLAPRGSPAGRSAGRRTRPRAFAGRTPSIAHARPRARGRRRSGSPRPRLRRSRRRGSARAPREPSRLGSGSWRSGSRSVWRSSASSRPSDRRAERGRRARPRSPRRPTCRRHASASPACRRSDLRAIAPQVASPPALPWIADPKRSGGLKAADDIAVRVLHPRDQLAASEALGHGSPPRWLVTRPEPSRRCYDEPRTGGVTDADP
jgi:hypothetical protein